MTEQERIEQCDLIDKYAELISTGNIYNLSFEQQRYIVENNLNAKYLLTFEQWNDKGARIIKGSKALRLPNKEPLFDMAQTNYKQMIDEDFPRLNYDPDNINARQLRDFFNEFIKDNPNKADYEQLLMESILNRFLDNFNCQSLSVVDDPEHIDLELYSSMNKEMFNYIKAMYNELKVNDEVKFSELVDYSLKKIKGDEYYEPNDTSYETENEVLKRPISSSISRDEGQWNIDGSFVGRGSEELSTTISNETLSNPKMGERERQEAIRTIFSKENTSDVVDRQPSKRDSERRDSLSSNVETKESDDDSSLLNSNEQLSLFDNVVAITKEEERQERIAEETEKILYQDEVDDFTNKIDTDINVVMLGGSHVEQGKFRLYDLFINHKDMSITEKAKLLAKEYGDSGHSAYGNEEDRNMKWVNASSKGITIEYKDNSNLHVKWNEAAKHLNQLVNEGKYLSSEELDKYRGWYKDWQSGAEYNSLFDTQTTFKTDNENELSEDDETLLNVAKDMSVEELEEAGLDETSAKALNFASNVEIDTEAQNYHITDDNVGVGKPRERYQNNINAIKLLKKLEQENRPATTTEQDTLSKYVGWGGLADAFDKDKWPTEYEELKTLLTETEYENARSSVNTAFFTQPAVIDTIYKALDKFGFKNGNILEPSCGVGNFFGRLPEKMSNSSLFGVELDDISAHIAQRLYPNAFIQHKGYENADFDDNFFDVAIGNVPFGEYKVQDRRYDKNNFLIHDYFFAKTIDKVRPNGVIALVTSKGTMDKLNSKAREYIAQRCNLIGAIRLPKETFKGAAGTEAISDIIFLQKREQPCVNMPEWINSNSQNFMKVKYFDNAYMSKEELENKIIDLYMNHDFAKIKDLSSYCETNARARNEYINTPYISADYYEEPDGYYSETNTRQRWRNNWDSTYGYQSPSSRYNFAYCGGINLYKWYKENPDEVIQIVADSGKFKSTDDKRVHSNEHADVEFEKAKQWLEIGNDSIKEQFMNNYVNPLVDELIKETTLENNVLDENGEIVKKGMTMQPVNTYFTKNKDMVIGDTSITSARFGYDISVSTDNIDNLSQELDKRLENLNYEYKEAERVASINKDVEVLKADLNIDNYSYGFRDNKIYYRTNATMELIPETTKGYSMLYDLLTLKQNFKDLVSAQLEECSDDELHALQKDLNDNYDKFVEKHGTLKKNDRLISDFSFNDSSFVVLTALEKWDEEDEKNPKFLGKADIFTERTIHKQENIVEHCDTCYDALIVSLQTRLGVDLDLMQQLTDKSKDEILNDLQGSLYRDHNTDDEVYIVADEYLSGNVKRKWNEAKEHYDLAIKQKDETTSQEQIAKLDEKIAYLETNLTALEKAFPPELPADLIDMSLGATWIPIEVYQQFMEDELINGNYYRYSKPVIQHSDISNHWAIENKKLLINHNDSYLTEVYGLKDNGHNALDIFETCLNLGTEEVAWYTEDPETGKRIKHVDKNKTLIAKDKQEAIKSRFQQWLNEGVKLRTKYGSETETNVKDYLAKLYNDKFNCIVDRKYNTDLVNPKGMAVIKDDKTGMPRELYPHQKEVIAKALFGGNTGIFHSVGAGKTLSMITIAMESKRLGLCNKSLFVAPKSIVGQWGAAFITAYPNANILVADEKSFTKENRARFISKVATGNYDAIIISNDQFKLLELSNERVCSYIQEDIDKITEFVNESKRNNPRGRNWSVKQAESYKKKLETRIKKRNEMKHDDYITFEELGCDKLFIDESHNFKNLAFETQLSRVKGVGSSADSQKSNDLYYKTRYLNELTGNKGIVFASGTPVSNYLAELYTIQRYLQPTELENLGISNFDSWVSIFGKIVEDRQIDVTGTTSTKKAMLKSYHNLPELMSIFRQVADIKTKEDMIEYLDLPDVEKVNVLVPRTDEQSEYLDEINERVDAVRNNLVSPTEDNMLKITTDGRKLALDQRLVGKAKPDSEETKSNYVAENVFKEYQNSMDTKGTQFIFSDYSTPKDNNEFDIYNDIKDLLIEKDIPENEIAFIHDYEKQKDKNKLFKAINNGEIRVVFGSTSKLGTGVDCPNKAVALHHVDVPWKPSDIEQREGRVVRKGNENDKVRIYRYVTKDTFDAYSWQIIENKSKFISQIMKSETSAREFEDLDEEVTLDAAQIKAIATGNPLLKESMDLENDIKALNIAKNGWIKGLVALKENVNIKLPEQINMTKEHINNIKHDLEIYEANKPNKILNPDTNKEQYELNITINGKTYTDYKQAGLALQEQAKGLHYPQDVMTLTNKGKLIGKYLGFDIRVGATENLGHYDYLIGDKWNTIIDSLENPTNLTTKLIGSLDNLPNVLAQKKEQLSAYENDLEKSKDILTKPFDREDELKQKQTRLNEIYDAMKQASEYGCDEIVEDDGLIHYDEKGNIINGDNPEIDNSSDDEFDEDYEEEKGYEK